MTKRVNQRDGTSNVSRISEDLVDLNDLVEKITLTSIRAVVIFVGTVRGAATRGLQMRSSASS